jgi:thiamine biosynthesis lipoprotein
MVLPESQSTRREFLTGKSAARALEQSLPTEEPSDAMDSVHEGGTPETYLVQVGRTAMACDFEIMLNAGQYAGATEAAIAALDLVDQLESQMTVYRPVSEVQSINQRAAHEAVLVEERLFRLLERAAELHTATQGAFDITSGPLSKVWGFFRRSGEQPTPDAVAQALSRVGGHWVELDSTTRSVRFRHSELEINLNAIGKGHAVDRCAEILDGHQVKDYLIHGGHSSVRARGARATKESSRRGWRVDVRHPFRADEPLAELWLRDRALGTSGSGNQFFHFQGKRYGHVIDPRTGWPAEHVLSATVLAPDAATADALATALFVMGVDQALSFCGSRPELAALLVAAGQRAGDITLHAIGLQPDEWRSCEVE